MIRRAIDGSHYATAHSFLPAFIPLIRESWHRGVLPHDIRDVTRTKGF
jgi:hypothetical protein